MNTLEAVFWDYPKFTDFHYLQQALQDSDNSGKRQWIMARFLEHGRIVDTWKFFTMKEIIEALPNVKISAHARKKWQRMIEVYGDNPRKS